MAGEFCQKLKIVLAIEMNLFKKAEKWKLIKLEITESAHT